MRTTDSVLARLVGDVARGDQAAFRALYDRVAGQVYGLACLVLRDRVEAERVTERALVEVWRTAPRFDPTDGNPIVWILATTHRVAVDRAGALWVADPWSVLAQHLDMPADQAATKRRDGPRGFIRAQRLTRREERS
ncbi:MAG: sigma factor [Egibacteraceae bacterium]